MTNNETLFPDHKKLKEYEDYLTHELKKSRLQDADRDIMPIVDLSDFRKSLAQFDFQSENELKDVMDWTIRELSHGVVQTTSPGYFGLFNPAPTFPAECADRIASAFNPQICVWTHAPVAVEIEKHVIEKIAKRVGLKGEIGGHFTSGGSEANNTAVICALTVKEKDFDEKGARAFKGQPRMYVSKESHLAWLKIAHLVGIGRDAVRLVNTDGQGRMDAMALKESIECDLKNGDVPFMIAATAGTTNAGMIDPLNECAELARKFDLWFHVDAAWGGAMIVLDEVSCLSGIDKADSVTIDAHKWFATTMGTGMFLTCRQSVLGETFRVDASYMPKSNVQDDQYVNSIMWSRRFIGLRLFLGLATVGWSGYAEHIKNSIELINELILRMEKIGWKHVNASPMAVACFRPLEGVGKVEKFVNEVLEQGHSWVSVAKYEGQDVLRACVTNGRTEKKHIERFVSVLAG